jgi:hypothetical protein
MGDFRMSLPERASPRRRLQILDDETRDGRQREKAPAQFGSWARSFIARMTGLIRTIGGKN